ncbi:MAG TPA: hypothetical protein VLM40_06800 [Gemmata sp.]|nr:hypothetical protein [Gemmata sp.]
MMDWLTTGIGGLNTATNALGNILAPIALVPGWLSITAIAIATGAALLLMFKHTSNQRAIKRIRKGIRANLLAVKLFRDDIGLAFRSLGLVLLGALKLLLQAIVPLLVMMVPVTLFVAQLALWYQARPLHVGEEAVVTVKLNGEAGSPMPAVSLEPTPGIEDASGPVRAMSTREVCWNIVARKPGYHTLRFNIDGQSYEKELAVGDGFMRVSMKRPEWDFEDVLAHPRENAFHRDSPVKSIEIQYSTRASRISGTDRYEETALSWMNQVGWWAGYWFVVACIAGFLLRGVLKVNF